MSETHRTIPDISKYKDVLLVFINNHRSEATTTMLIPLDTLTFPSRFSIDGLYSTMTLEETSNGGHAHKVTFISYTEISRESYYDNLEIWVR